MAGVDLEMLYAQALQRQGNPIGAPIGYLRDNSPTLTLGNAFRYLTYPQRGKMPWESSKKVYLNGDAMEAISKKKGLLEKAQKDAEKKGSAYHDAVQKVSRVMDELLPNDQSLLNEVDASSGDAVLPTPAELDRMIQQSFAVPDEGNASDAAYSPPYGLITNPDTSKPFPFPEFEFGVNWGLDSIPRPEEEKPPAKTHPSELDARTQQSLAALPDLIASIAETPEEEAELLDWINKELSA